ncbi:MAG: PQQ-binding-like beta-propeller repeat protein, partial [Kiritimatiellae bacterium]|nr:PQQ-binding-like beta-propeller repeat protein [Kiritimatiellia bacterium]
VVGVAPAVAAEVSGMLLRGTITGGGRPLDGVAVTNGCDVAVTGKDGGFVLPRRGNERFVSVTVPSGWRTGRFYLPVVAESAAYDFVLEPWGPSAVGRELRFVHISDSEIYKIAEQEKEFAAKVREIAGRYEAAFIVHTGDICYPQGLKAHITLMNAGNMGRPVFYCLGNHDLVKGEYGEQLFESLYGPAWHSFDACGVHFCVTPMKNGDVKPSYTPEQVATWLKNDLAAVPRSRPVVLFNHSFFDGALFTIKDLRKGVFALAGFDVTAACNLVGLVFGHYHMNHFRRFGKIAAIQTAPPLMGGVDLSPASIRVVKADATGRLTSDTRYTPKDIWPTVGKAEKGGWIAKMPGPVYLGSPVSDGRSVFAGSLDDDGLGTGAVTAFDLKTGETVWSVQTPNSIKNQMALFRGRVIAQDADGMVRAYDCRTGATIWTRDPANTTLRAFEYGLAVDATRGVVYAEIDARLTAIDAASGRELWQAKTFKLYGSTASCMCVGDGLVIGETQWHGLYAADPETGEMLWARDRKGPLGSKEQLRWRSGTVTIADGKVYATGGKWFFELDAKTGNTLREKEYPFSLGTTTKPLLVGNRIFLGSCNAGLVALDRATLEIAWQGEVGETFAVSGSYCRAPQHQVSTNPLMVAADLVCAAAGDGTIRFWDVETGAEKRRTETGAPYFNAPLLTGNRLYAADFAGYVRAIPV